MTGVHGLQQVEGLGSAHFADDDALGAHPQAVLDQITHGDHALAFEVGRAGFQTHHVGLLQLQFGRILAGDHPLGRIDEGGHGVQQGGLARAGAAGDDDVATAGADHAQNPCAFGGDRGVRDQIAHGQLVFFELPDGQGRPVQRERRRDDVDAAAIGQAGVADGRAFIHPSADLTDDALTDVHQLGVVAEADIGQLHLAADFDEDATGAIDHDVGDVVAFQKGFERAIAQHIIDDVLNQIVLLGGGHGDVLDRDQLGDDVADFFAGRLLVELGELAQINRVQERRIDGGLGGVIIIALIAHHLGDGPAGSSRLGCAQLIKTGRLARALGRGGLGQGLRLHRGGVGTRRVLFLGARGYGRAARRRGGRRGGVCSRGAALAEHVRSVPLSHGSGGGRGLRRAWAR